ncbi:hypothetical protein VTJ49DRAFT_974 [Mycothermus thermophilus]|uniref:AHC1-like C2H2 zinc-finger domain-containing protein n=1 Tax=Humicola insolens TaxID=85995 RepID=A0ABR3VDP4_HUMIN
MWSGQCWFAEPPPCCLAFIAFASQSRSQLRIRSHPSLNTISPATFAARSSSSLPFNHRLRAPNSRLPGRRAQTGASRSATDGRVFTFPTLRTPFLHSVLTTRSSRSLFTLVQTCARVVVVVEALTSTRETTNLTCRSVSDRSPEGASSFRAFPATARATSALSAKQTRQSLRPPLTQQSLCDQIRKSSGSPPHRTHASPVIGSAAARLRQLRLCVGASHRANPLVLTSLTACFATKKNKTTTNRHTATSHRTSGFPGVCGSRTSSQQNPDMSMFRFWASESRGSERSSEDADQRLGRSSISSMDSEPTTPTTPGKRRPDFVDTSACAYQPSKRIKTEEHPNGLPSPVSATADREEMGGMPQQSNAVDLDAVRETIQMQFGLEILLKHKELRLINQELARCQIALEQLRRCHLMPYPVQCPTPQQMLDISSGKGPALKSAHGEPVPKWAPPFGVVEGPYARHYAKWLIPDPMFDGAQPEPLGVADGTRARSAAEGRATRNSLSDAVALGKARPVRSGAGQKLHALTAGYSQPRDKQLGCILKRPDGVTVKLVCKDCNRWDFSSTQGFINHCRIAHKREFKSHDMAAIECGQPIEVDESGAVVGDDRKTSPSVPSGLAHPLARPDTQSDTQPYKVLLSRIKASVELYKAGQLPGVQAIPGMPKKSRNPSDEPPRNLVACPDTPYLSQLMKKRKLGGNLKEQVADAKTKVNLDCVEDEDADESDSDRSPAPVQHNTPAKAASTGARTPAVMRVPSRSGAPLPDAPAGPWANHGKGQHATADTADSPRLPETPMYDDEMDGVEELSPNTMVSNNAPSLVSDDGEYDDESDDASSAVSEDAENADSADDMSDVAEINIDDESDAAAVQATPRPVTRRRLDTKKKDENRHVTFVSPAPVPTPPAKRGRRKNL